jgi:hypothetical protein
VAAAGPGGARLPPPPARFRSKCRRRAKSGRIQVADLATGPSGPLLACEQWRRRNSAMAGGGRAGGGKSKIAKGGKRGGGVGESAKMAATRVPKLLGGTAMRRNGEAAKQIAGNNDAATRGCSGSGLCRRRGTVCADDRGRFRFRQRMQLMQRSPALFQI